MSSKTAAYLKQNWKVLLNIATVVVLVILVLIIHKEIINTFRALHKVDFWALLLLVPIEFWNYHAQAKLYQGLFKIIGDDLSYKKLFKVALELNFVNSVFPSGGVTGISYFGARMRSDKLTGTRAALIQIMKLMMVFVSFEALLILGLFFMAVRGHVNGLTILISSSVSTVLVVGTMIFAFIVGDNKRTNDAFSFMARWLNRLIHMVRPHHPPVNLERFRRNANQIHEDYILMMAHQRQLKWPLIHAFEANLSEVLAVYVVYVAFGHWVNLGAVILAYAVANFAGLVSVFPSGVGIYEALMTAILVAGGIPARLSLPVTVMYRVLNTLLQLPPGYVYYHRALREPAGETADAT